MDVTTNIRGGANYGQEDVDFQSNLISSNILLQKNELEISERQTPLFLSCPSLSR